MSSFFVQKEISQDFVNESIKSMLQDYRIEDIKINSNGKCVIYTKWIKYTLNVASKNLKTKIVISRSGNPSKALLILCFGLFINLFLAKSFRQELKDMSEKVFEILSK